MPELDQKLIEALQNGDFEAAQTAKTEDHGAMFMKIISFHHKVEPKMESLQEGVTEEQLLGRQLIFRWLRDCVDLNMKDQFDCPAVMRVDDADTLIELMKDNRVNLAATDRQGRTLLWKICFGKYEKDSQKVYEAYANAVDEDALNNALRVVAEVDWCEVREMVEYIDMSEYVKCENAQYGHAWYPKDWSPERLYDCVQVAKLRKTQIKF